MNTIQKRATRRNRTNGPTLRRAGVAAVEFAVCLPVLVLITLAFIDLTNLIYFRQTLKIAAYDAARTAAESGSTEAEVRAAAQRLLDMRGVENSTLTLPNNFNTITRGTMMDFDLSVPISELTYFTGMDFWNASLGNAITVEVSAVKE